MSLPITAVGPLKVLMKPILTEFCAMGGAVASASTASNGMDAFLISVSPLVLLLAPRGSRPTSYRSCRRRDRSPDSMVKSELSAPSKAVYRRGLLKQADRP